MNNFKAIILSLSCLGLLILSPTSLWSYDTLVLDSATTQLDTQTEIELITKRDSMTHFAKSFLNKPYCYGGRIGKCFDCSGLILTVYSEFGIELPPSSSTQAICGNFIKPENAKPGDLIFFNGRNANSEDIGHVGMIVEVSANDIYFIHSSVRSGVIISSLSDEYYKNRFMCIKNQIDTEIEEIENKFENAAN